MTPKPRRPKYQAPKLPPCPACKKGVVHSWGGVHQCHVCGKKYKDPPKPKE